MHDDILWQAYSNNGRPLKGVGGTRADFTKDQSMVMGAVHVWIWRSRNGMPEILLQKRSSALTSYPGFYDISYAGHIDLGEDPIDACVREGKEEIGITVDQSQLYYIFGIRTPLDQRELDQVYLYELNEEVSFAFDDGEVDELKWVQLDEFVGLVKDPDGYNLVNQGTDYFSLLVSNIRRIVDENN